jgi:hypothetical protein
MPSVRVRSAAAALAMLTMLALTGCGEDEDQTQASSTAGSSTSTAAPEEVDDEDDAAENSDDEILTGEACLYGTWYLDNDVFKALLEQAGGEVRSVTGWAIVSYHPDGTSAAAFDEWTTVATYEGSMATMVRNGEDLATYSVSGDTLTTTETAAGSVLTMTMLVNGQEMTMQAPHEEFSVTTGTFTCEADTLTISAQGATSVLLREH